MNRLEVVKNELKYSIQNVYKFKETKKEVIDFYTKNENKLNSIKKETFDNYSFLIEVLQKCEKKEKQKYIDKIYNKTVKLETHKYNPTSNALHLSCGNIIITPDKTDIESSIAYIIDRFSLNQLKKI